MLYGFEGMPSNLKHNKLYGASPNLQLAIGSDYGHWGRNNSDFDASTVTYNSWSGYATFINIPYNEFTPGSWQNISVGDISSYPSIAKSILSNGIYVTGSIIDYGLPWYTRINGGYPYLTVTYDDSVKIPSKVELVSGPSGTGISSLSALAFSWRYVKNSSDYCAVESWAQSSAKIYWKASDESNWHSINISGTGTSYTAPAETFPSGKTISYYVQGTDEDGTVSNTSTYSFSTATASLRLINYPSGSNVYVGQALTFSWDITETAGSHTQTSAVFYWKRQSASSWTSVSISGNTKRYTAPANTFPTGTTVQWYVVSTDKNGVVWTSSTQSFTTEYGSIKNISYPSGNSVNYGSVLAFKWNFTSSSGEYAQGSATFYWRASTSDPWSSIAASGGTKGVNVPAYTFPSNATITWYVSGTDSGGTSSSTSQLSFKTASPQITPQGSPTSGYVDPRNQLTFRWYFTDGSNTYDQQSASLKWRVSGASSWNTVAASGTTQSVTLAANTFPTQSTIEWKLSGTVRGGTSSETSVYSFSTTASTAYAVCQEPVGKAEDGSKPIVLRWTIQNADGSTPSRTIVKWKKSTEAATAWRTVLDTTSTVYTCTIPAGTFSAGGIDWQVVAYNRDSVAGPASLASFVCIVAPAAPQGLSATAVPRTTISWQSSGQEAYEIEIDGETVAANYGPSIVSWRKDYPLSDGEHLIRVRIQGEYGLWSDWSSTTISVQNVPPITMTMTGKFRVDAQLNLTLSSGISPINIHWYRDGKRIAWTTGPLNYTDRFVLGEHEYYAETWFTDGNYARSNIIKGKMCTEELLIGLASGGEWLHLKYSEKSDRNISYSWGVKSEQIYVAGSRWPVLETSPYETMIGDYSCAFRDQESVRKLEQMRGQMVIMKSRDGSVIIGGLIQMKKTATAFFTTFSFSVQQNHWEDFVRYEEDG